MLKVVLRSRMDEVIQVGRGLCWLMMSGSGDVTESLAQSAWTVVLQQC